VATAAAIAAAGGTTAGSVAASVEAGGTVQAAGSSGGSAATYITLPASAPPTVAAPPPPPVELAIAAVRRIPTIASKGVALGVIRAFFPGATFSKIKGLENVIECTVYRNGRYRTLQFAKVGTSWQRTAVIPPGTNSKG
jgi:hypothetical protein